jgi:hypothetical protein
MKEPLRKCLSCYLVLAIFVMGVVPKSALIVVLFFWLTDYKIALTK